MEYQYFVSESRLFTNMQSWLSEVYVMVVRNGIDGTQRSLAHLVRRLTCDSSVMIIDKNPHPLFVT